EILESGQDERAIEAAMMVRFLLVDDFPDEEPFLVLWMASLLFRGNDRIMTEQNIPFLVAAINLFGPEEGILFCFLRQPCLFDFPDRPRLPPVHIRIDINNMSTTDCRLLFRFDPDVIRTITERLPIPNILSTPTGRDTYCIVEGFCIVVYRMSFPRRWCDMVRLFGRHESALSRIF
ncbi:MAG: hypothetical protein AAFO91_11615, partial [Bacteroidota bacterium]